MTASPKNDPIFLEEKNEYEVFAEQLVNTALVNDPWYEGVPIFRSAPMILNKETSDEINEAASRIGALYQELVGIVADDEALLDTYFHLPPHYKLMWLSSDALWHHFARMDMFRLNDGSLKICEINADTPSGQIEAIIPNQLMHDEYKAYKDPNVGYKDMLWRAMLQAHKAHTGADKIESVGIIYPTDLPEDITLIRLYQIWFEEMGARVVLGAPQNISFGPGRTVRVLDEPVDVVFRHYKTDWWGERQRIYDDENELWDTEPLRRELATLLESERQKKVTVVNPFGSLIPQNKLSMAFFWDHMNRFSEPAQKTIRDLIPETRRLDDVGREKIRDEKDLWVLKSDFGCEGDEVTVGPNVTQEYWESCVMHAMPHIWIVQRHFDVRPVTLDDRSAKGKYLPNYGVYLIAGQPAGLMVRLAPENITTGYDARVVPTFIS